MNGVILGRFMPPHNGHLYLVDFARSMVDHLYVLVCTLSSEPIPGGLRFAWMQELAPHCTVVHITEEIPEARRGTAGATTIWADAIRRAVPVKIDRVFASEEYGWDLAHRLDAQFVPVDPGRHNIPVSATAIREQPYVNWRYIPAVVRPWFVRHVVMIDQSDLAGELARRLDTVVAHPYHEYWQLTWNTFGGRRDVIPLTTSDVVRGARATVTALARQANQILFHDLRRVADLRDLAEEIKPHLVISGLAQPRELTEHLRDSETFVIRPEQATPEEVAAILGIQYS